MNPQPLDFGAVPIGESKTVASVITNVGNCTLTVNDICISGSEAFQFTETIDGNDVVESSPELPLALEVEDSYQFDVTFSPTEEGDYEAVIVIRSDDPSIRSFENLCYGSVQ